LRRKGFSGTDVDYSWRRVTVGCSRSRNPGFQNGDDNVSLAATPWRLQSRGALRADAVPNSGSLPDTKIRALRFWSERGVEKLEGVRVEFMEENQGKD